MGWGLPAYFARGGEASRNIAVLAALGILSPGGGPDWDASPIPPEEAAAWVTRAAEAVGRKTDGPAFSVEPATLLAFRRRIETAFGEAEGIEPSRGVSAPGYEADPSAGAEAAEPSPAPEEVLSRAEAAAELSRAIQSRRDPFRRANLQSGGQDALLVAEGGGLRSLGLGPDPFFLRNMNGSASFLSSLDLQPDDALQWIEREGKIRLLQVQSRPLAGVSDQPFRYQSWHVRISREDLEARLREYVPCGRLIDLVPAKYGESRRVIELLVIGSEGPVRVTGLHVREVLNLRDSLFVLDRETDRTGGITHFIFSGKGWGHGVGLCQVGAFLMARKGATYGEILKTYYHGITIEKRAGGV